MNCPYFDFFFALINRLTYPAHVFEFRGQSYRFRDHLRPQEAPPH